MFLSIIGYLSEHLYISIVIACVIALVVFFIVGSIKQKKERELINAEYERNKIEAPKSRKRFIQGQEVNRQHLSIDDKKEEE